MNWRVTLLTSVATLIGPGCAARYTVEVRTEPSSASVEVVRTERGEDGVPMALPHATPTSHDFLFDAANVSYKVAISKERYDPEERILTREFAESLPLDRGIRVLQVPLKRSPFQDIEKAEVVVDPERGLTISFRRVRAYEEDIERQGVAASKIVQLGEGLSIGGVTVSGDGKRVAFGVVERMRDERGNDVFASNIRGVSTEGGGVTQITTGRWLDIDPSFSPDGKFLYFASNRLRNEGLDLQRISSESTGGGIAVVQQQNEGWSRSPSEAATGLITYSYLPGYARATGVSHVWTIGGENQYPTQIREGSQPRVSPQGDFIVYSGADKKLWKISTRGQAPVQLTTDPKTVESEPTWSPDGKYLVYVSNEGKDSTGKPNNDIWIMRADGTQRKQLTTNGSDDVTPVVDPEKRWIYFVSNRGYKWGIWRMPWPTGLE